MHLTSSQITFIITIATCINFVCAHLLVFIWKQPEYYYIIIGAASFLAGAIIVDFSRSILYALAALIIGSLISVAISIAPAIIYGADRMIVDANILYYTNYLAKLLLISLPLCIFVVIFGAFIGERVQQHIRTK
jgi:hypothetical protein